VAWRFDPGEALPDAFQRVAREEIENLEEMLADRDADAAKATHEARQGFKRLRALLRLARPSIGDSCVAEDRFWRDAGRRLARLRDGTVLRETFDAVATNSGGRSRQDLGAIRSRMSEGAEPDTKEAKRLLKLTLSDLRRGKRRLAKLRWPGNTGALRQGLKTSQARLRKSWKKARADPTAQNLHEWRKRVKDQSAHLRLLRGIAPTDVKTRRDSEKRLAEKLGLEHDLCVLVERLGSMDLPANGEAAREKLVKAIERRRKALRRDAFQIAKTVCSEGAADFAANLSTAWRRASDGRTDEPRHVGA
jgi:CHAD domain-containing protein